MALARPIPELAPVTTATFASDMRSLALICGADGHGGADIAIAVKPRRY
jgi:hypothetical protein